MSCPVGGSRPKEKFITMIITGADEQKKKKNNNNNKGMTRKNVHSVDKDDGGVFALIKLLSWSEKIGQGNY